jgi:hypothetical protein
LNQYFIEITNALVGTQKSLYNNSDLCVVTSGACEELALFQGVLPLGSCGMCLAL